MTVTSEINACEIEIVKLTARIKTLEDKTKAYSWFLKMLLGALTLSVVGLLVSHLSWH